MVIFAHVHCATCRQPLAKLSAIIELRCRAFLSLLMFIVLLGHSLHLFCISLSSNLYFPASINILLHINYFIPILQSMSHGSTSPSGTALSGNTLDGSSREFAVRESASKQISPPPGILELQSPLAKKCFEQINKLNSGALKKGEASFKIHSILAASGEKLKSSRLLLSCLSAFLTNMSPRSQQLQREEGSLSVQHIGSPFPAGAPPDPVMNLNQGQSLLSLAKWLGKRKRSMSPTYLGSSKINLLDQSYDLNSKQGQQTQSESKWGSSILQDALLFLIQNGLILSKENLSTLTAFAEDFTPHPPITNTLEKLNSSLEPRMLPNPSPHMETWKLLLTSPVMYISLPSLIEQKNSNCISDTSSVEHRYG